MRRWALALVVLAAVVVAGSLLLTAGERTAGPSVLSSGGRGWLAARLYLEAREARVTLLDRPWREIGEKPPAPVLVTSFPWSRQLAAGGAPSLERWLSRGGTLVVGYSGSEWAAQEGRLLGDLGLALVPVRDEAPWGYFGWRRHLLEEWTLEPAADLAGGARPLVVRAFQLAPESAPGDRVLYRRRGTGRPLVFSRPFGDGRVVVLPTETLANARLGTAGSGDLLESLLAWLGPHWSFDEYHHGLMAPEAVAAALPSGVIDLFLFHLGALYGLGLWTLARRFGPAWREPRARSGSAASFLRGLGALHHRLGHHPEAARRLLERVVEIDPRLELPAELAARAPAADGPALVALAAEVARHRGVVSAVVGGGPKEGGEHE